MDRKGLKGIGLFPVAVAIALLLWSAAGLAADYPARSIRMVVPYTPGGATDAAARLISERLGRRVGQPVVVENKPGAGALIGSDQVAKAPPDGYMLLVHSSALSVVPAVTAKMPFDPATDLTQIALLAELPLVFAASNAVPANNVKDLIAYMKAHPNELNYGAYGITGTPNILMILFNQRAGVTSTLITYKGAGQAMPEMIAGRLHLMFDGATSSVPLARSGRIKLLAVLSAQRSPLLPDVPSLSETLSGVVGESWLGIAGPKGLPAPIVNQLNREINAVLQEQDLVAAMREQMLVVKTTTPQGLLAQVQREVAYWLAATKQANIQPE